MAVTGSQAMASCALTPDTVAKGMMSVPDERPAKVTLHHPMGEMVVVVDYEIENGVFQHQSAGLIRTCENWRRASYLCRLLFWQADGSPIFYRCGG